MTYPDTAVIAAVSKRFVPLRLDHLDPNVRKLNLVWLPTLYVVDKREVIHYRSVNSVPPAEFLDVLDLGEAHARLKQASYKEADDLIDQALARRRHGPHSDELLYWSAIAKYFANWHDHDARDEIWTELRTRYPGSPWTHRIPDKGVFDVKD